MLHFNINYVNPSPSCNKIDIISNLYSLKQIVSHPTHFSHSGVPSTIDLAFIPSSVHLNFCNILPPVSNSDHYSILFSIRVDSCSSPNFTSPHLVWLYDHADFSLANQLLDSIPWSSILLPTDTETSWLIFRELFEKIIQKTIPSEMVYSSSNSKSPWINQTILSTIKRRNMAFLTANRSGSPSKWQLFRNLRNRVVSLIRKAKTSFLHHLANSSSSIFWSSIKRLRKNPSVIPTLNTIFNTPKSKAEALNQFFATCFNKLTPPLSNTPPSAPPFSCSSDLCTSEQISCILSKLSPDTSSGPDNITAKMLINTASSVSVPLSLIFNSSLCIAVIPSDWKISHVSPIPKTSPPSGSTCDYRPISLLSLVGKTFERHIFNLIYDHLKLSNFLSSRQFGFRPGFSTETALLFATNSWFSSLEHGTSVCSVFLDLKKAFDSVPHRPLLNTLATLNLPSHLLCWIHSYLSNRSQRVKVSGCLSQPCQVLSGVPQGSILGPLLFLIYVNDITNVSLSPQSNLILYADDILYFHPVISSSCMISIQNDLNLISDWISSHFLSINTNKSKYMIITRKSSQFVSSLPTVTLNSSPIQLVSSFKYLGVIISSNLSWSLHIQSVSSKVRKLTGMIYRNFYKHSSPQILLKLYNALILPHFNYCSSVWSPPDSSVNSSLLDSSNYFSLKVCSKIWSLNYHSLISHINIPSLVSRRNFSKLILLYKINNGLLYFPPNVLIPVPAPLHYSRHYNKLNFKPPFCSTQAYSSSFFPSVISLWNSLPDEAKTSSSLSSFRQIISLLSSQN